MVGMKQREAVLSSKIWVGIWSSQGSVRLPWLVAIVLVLCHFGHAASMNFQDGPITSIIGNYDGYSIPYTLTFQLPLGQVATTVTYGKGCQEALGIHVQLNELILTTPGRQEEVEDYLTRSASCKMALQSESQRNAQFTVPVTGSSGAVPGGWNVSNSPSFCWILWCW
jgi:hypothetical protein